MFTAFGRSIIIIVKTSNAMSKSLPFLLSACCIFLFVCVTRCSAQDNKEVPSEKMNDRNAPDTKQASIYFNAPVSEVDKNFIVTTFSSLTEKVISCVANPYTQFITITYTEKLKEKDLLEVLQLNGYDAYLKKGDHIKIILTKNGEAREEGIK